MRKLKAAEETSNVDTDDNTETQERAKRMRHQKARRQLSSSEENDSETDSCSVLSPFPKLKQAPALLKRVLDPEKRTVIHDERDFGTPKRQRENETLSHKKITGMETLSPKNLLHPQEDSPSRIENASKNGIVGNFFLSLILMH